MNWKKKLTTCAVISTVSVFIMHMINRIINFLATVDNLLDTSEGHYYEWRFGKIFYTKEGSGKPILLIHDLNTASSGYEWHKLTRHLSKTNTVYTIDLLGCGRSHQPDITYTNYLYVQMITDFIKHIIGEKTDVVASGLSSSFVLMACHNDDTIIDKIVMIAPSSLTSLAKTATPNTKTIKILLNTPVIGTLIYNILFSKEKLKADLEKRYFYNSDKLNDHLIDVCHEAAHARGSKYLFSSLKGCYVNANISQCLPTLDNSIFIITGDSNVESSNLAAKQYQNAIPSIEIVNIEKSLLVPQLEQPEEFLKQLQILLETE